MNPSHKIKVAIVGAGVAGLSCARALVRRGMSVVVFEKSRGVGGRTSTRRSGDSKRFNHGAQYFCCSTKTFEDQAKNWLEEKAIKPWKGRLVTLDENGVQPKEQGEKARFVGMPGMNAAAKKMAEGIDVRLNSQILHLQRSNDDWVLEDSTALRLDFDAVVLAIPAPQAADLLHGVHPFSDVCNAVNMLPTIAAMVSFERPLHAEFDAAFIQSPKLSWAMKYPHATQAGGENWTLHATHGWSEQNLERDPTDVARELVEEFLSMIGDQRASVDFVAGHRWRYAVAANPIEDLCLADPKQHLAICGDWCGGGKVEDAWIGGQAAAANLVDQPNA